MPTCWPTFGLTCWPKCWCSFLHYVFPSKKQPTFLEFHSFACWLSITNVRVWSSSIFDNRLHDRWWWEETRGSTRKWIRQREEEGMYANLVQELLVEDTRTYKEMMRMSYKSYRKILGFIEPHITSKDSVVIGGQIIIPAERLVLAIRFLATGETYCSLILQFWVSERAISYIIDEVKKAIAQYIGKDYTKILSTSEDWWKISETFQSRWNFPNCLGAIDGKHKTPSWYKLWIFQL